MPNVTFSTTAGNSGSSNAAVVFIRGVGQDDIFPTIDPGVGIYLDGVYVSRTLGSVFDTADLAQVEVLRGPQGTLFGKNTIGAAIQITTTKPADKFGGYAEVGVTNLTNKAYLLSGFADLAGSSLADGVYARPCEWFLSVRRSF